jgi:hypothetical protein
LLLLLQLYQQLLHHKLFVRLMLQKFLTSALVVKILFGIMILEMF